ncbi:putative halogenase [Mycena olivaceomarginata]|nr:putative halogenase [Mycena olivaceomarginata]
MPVPAVPTSTTILVIGGGPAGAYTASALARGKLISVVQGELLTDIFPRYHIGESMLPSCRPFLRFIGAEEKIVNHGFTVKVGAAVKLNQYKREGYTDFISSDPNKAAWNVVRSEFDEILLRHAAESGACVCEGVQVTGITFSSDDERRPVSAAWKSDVGSKGEVRFKWLNIAFWAYWTGTGTYEPGTRRENAPWFEALTDETGWSWFIPLHNGTVSVGVVLKEEVSRTKRSMVVGSDVNKTHYLTQLKLAPVSYSASYYAGPNYRIAGDAGVHLAFANALSAASTIAASIRGQCTEAEAIAFHNSKTGTSYTRFLLVVLSIYRQINAQAAPVLSDIDEDNFDRAFDFLRPIIQGTADADQSMTEQTLQRTMDFCEHALGPTTPKMHAAVADRVDPALLAHDGPIMDTKAAAALAGKDEEAKQVLWRVNARKAVNGIYDWEDNFQRENLEGFVVVLEHGRLGLRRVGDSGAL